MPDEQNQCLAEAASIMNIPRDLIGPNEKKCLSASRRPKNFIWLKMGNTVRLLNFQYFMTKLCFFDVSLRSEAIAIKTGLRVCLMSKNYPTITKTAENARVVCLQIIGYSLSQFSADERELQDV